MKLAAALPEIGGRNYFALALGVLFATVAVMVAYSVAAFGVATEWTGENGILELTQQVLLTAAGLMFVGATLLVEPGKPAAERRLIFAALCLTFLLRETDVADPTQGGWLNYWLDASGKKILLIAAWGLVVLFAFAKLPWHTMVRSNFVFDNAFWLLSGAALLLTASWAIDREHVIIQHHLAVEEISEVLAYGLMVLASIQLVRGNVGVETVVSEPKLAAAEFA